MIKGFFLFGLLCLSISSFGQESNWKSCGQQLQSLLHQVYPACIRVAGWDTVNGRQNSAQFSSVIVSPDGLILTAAHTMSPGDLYRVWFPDGKEGFARGLGSIVHDTVTTWPDVAMMKMEGEGPWPYAKMGWSSSLSEGQPCFGISYPESLNQLKPMVRFGKILQPLDNMNFVKSTCIMETGDSGGPLFDWLGRVVALHSRIDKGEGLSYEVPVDAYRKYWTALNKEKMYNNWPSEIDHIDTDPSSFRLKLFTISAASGDMVKETLPGKNVRNMVLKISSSLYGNDHSIFGTVIRMPSSETIIVSKSSEIGTDPTTELSGRVVSLRVLLRDRENDLVALSIDEKLEGGLPVNYISEKATSQEDVGEILFSVYPDDSMKVGVLGMPGQVLPIRFSSGGMGVMLKELDGYPTVTDIDPKGAAKKAGMQVSDRIFMIDGKDVSSAEKINRTMPLYLPGDTIDVHWLRGADSLSARLVLAPRSIPEQNHAMNRFDGGKSIRRDGFKQVFVHDSRIHSYECGSPVLDIRGNMIGLNIARFSHTAVLAIDAVEISAFLQNVRK